MKTRKAVIGAILGVATLCGSAASAPALAGNVPLDAAIGAGAGVILGKSLGGREGAIIGGALGAAAGAAIGARSKPYAPQVAYNAAPVVYAPAPVYVASRGYGYSRWERERWEHARIERERLERMRWEREHRGWDRHHEGESHFRHG